MKKLILYTWSLLGFTASAQQTSNYVQYLFAKGVINPAASGTNINQKIYYTFGASRQWFQMNNPPKQNFCNFSYTIRPPRSYSYWQNVGAMVENDQSGIHVSSSYYVNYTIHLLLRKNLVSSFGVYAGFRQFSISPGTISPNDPVLHSGRFSTYSYPDLIPGFRLSSKKFFFDLCARQVTVLETRDYFSGRFVGGPSRLNPTIYAAYGTVIPLSDSWIALPSVAVQTPVAFIPSVNPNLMFYYSNRLGLGLAMRNLSFVSGIFQIRFMQNLSIGLAYSYTTSRISSVAPNSYEVMVGVAPMGMGGKHTMKHSIAKCPAMEY